jgi:glutathione S-transferase
MIGTSGARFLLRKYQANRASLDEHLARMEGVLAELQVTLDGDYILGELSYADIVMAAALQFVKPVDPRYIKLGPASARAWTDLELCDRYRDLLDWRDALYARDRKR